MGAGVQFVVVCAVQVLVFFYCTVSVTHVYTLSLSLSKDELYTKNLTPLMLARNPTKRMEKILSLVFGR